MQTIPTWFYSLIHSVLRRLVLVRAFFCDFFQNYSAPFLKSSYTVRPTGCERVFAAGFHGLRACFFATGFHGLLRTFFEALHASLSLSLRQCKLSMKSAKIDVFTLFLLIIAGIGYFFRPQFTKCSQTVSRLLFLPLHSCTIPFYPLPLPPIKYVNQIINP